MTVLFCCLLDWIWQRLGQMYLLQGGKNDVKISGGIWNTVMAVTVFVFSWRYLFLEGTCVFIMTVFYEYCHWVTAFIRTNLNLEVGGWRYPLTVFWKILSTHFQRRHFSLKDGILKDGIFRYLEVFIPERENQWSKDRDSFANCTKRPDTTCFMVSNWETI